MRIANDSPYGLGGAIYATDVPRALEVARQLRTGAVNINSALNIANLPFGGFKESGIGREGGRWGIDEYTEIQALAWK
jgi:acyl-CoA reductase-like NAD-dependent aldehyde dehydrogenase